MRELDVHNLESQQADFTAITTRSFNLSAIDWIDIGWISKI
ncbi:MAG: hypothetical protein AAGA40_11735 [Cyanobacteria bacterium P01_E01_bin.45]